MALVGCFGLATMYRLHEVEHSMDIRATMPLFFNTFRTKRCNGRLCFLSLIFCFLFFGRNLRLQRHRLIYT